MTTENNLVPSDADLKEECLRLRTAGWTLRQIKTWLERQDRVVGLTTISEWIREASMVRHEVDGHSDFNLQKIMGLGEIDEIIREVKTMIAGKVVKYEIPNEDGTLTIKYKEVSPMVLAQLYNTLESLVDKKNTIRGLTSKSTMAQFNQYNTTINASDQELAEEFRRANPQLLGQLGDILRKPGQVGSNDGPFGQNEFIEGEAESC